MSEQTYGVGWYGDTASIGQTGFVFTREEAARVAKEGAEAPNFWAWASAQAFTVDETTDGSALPVVRADLETEDETNEVFASWTRENSK